VAVGVAAAVQPILVIAAAFGARIVAWMAAQPTRGVYLLVVVIPLGVQMKRGLLTPVLRPAEFLILLVLGVVLVRSISGSVPGTVRFGQLTAVDWAFALVFAFGSIVPLVVMLFRGHAPSADDSLKLLLPAKHYIIYRVVVAVVTDRQKMLIVINLMLATSVVVAVIGILQVLGLLGVRQMLATYYEFDPTRLALDSVRATSTPVTSQALGTYLAVHATLAAALLSRAGKHVVWRRLLIATLALDVIGALASVTLTAALAVVIGFLLLAVLRRDVQRTMRLAVPVVLLAVVIFWPLLQERWAYQFTSSYASGGVPVSWAGRISSIVDVFWPEIQKDWLFGVSPVLQPPAFSENAWRSIENQILYLMYQGGALYAAAYLIFMAVVLHTLRSMLQQRRLDGPELALTRAALIAWALMLILGLFDPHFNLAVETEAAWTLLALATGATVRAMRADSATGE